MEALIIVIRKDPKVGDKINDTLRLPCKYQSKIGYHTFIQNNIFKELVNIMGTTITDLDIESKMKSSRKRHLEKRLF